MRHHPTASTATRSAPWWVVMLVTLAVAGCTPEGLVWSSKAAEVVAGPILSDDLVVVGMADGHITGLEQDRGAERWSAQVPLHEGHERDPDALVDLVDLEEGFAAVSRRGVVCVFSSDDGSTRWCSTAWADDEFTDTDSRFRAQLAAAEERLFLVTRDRRLIEMDADGHGADELARLEPLIPPTPWLATAGGLILTVGSQPEDDLVAGLAMEADGGAIRWSDTALLDLQFRIGAAAIDDDVVVAARRMVARYDHEGNELWRVGDLGEVTDAGSDFGTTATPLVRDAEVLVVIHADLSGADVRVLSVDAATGERRWASDLIPTRGGGSGDEVALAETDDGHVAVLTTDLHLLDGEDGTLIERTELGLERSSGLVVLDDTAVIADVDDIRRIDLPNASS